MTTSDLLPTASQPSNTQLFISAIFHRQTYRMFIVYHTAIQWTAVFKLHLPTPMHNTRARFYQTHHRFMCLLPKVMVPHMHKAIQMFRLLQ